MNGTGAFFRCSGTDEWHVKGRTEAWACGSAPTTRLVDGRTVCDFHARVARKAIA